MRPWRQRTRVWRGGQDRPSELWQRAPHPALDGFILGLWAGLSPEPCRHRVLPNGEASLMFHLGSTPQRLVERDGERSDQVLRTGYVSGLQQRPATFEAIEPATRVVSARLSPLGAWLLLGNLPQAELAQQVVGVDAVFERRSGVAELHERMSDAVDLGAALDELECWLVSRCLTARLPHGAVVAASASLATTGSPALVSAIAHDAGISPRRLRELFVESVGVSPKRLARISRFRRTLDRMVAGRPIHDLGGAPIGEPTRQQSALSPTKEANPEQRALAYPRKPLSDIALDSGYYDQAHLNREFREFALMTPHQYLEALGDGLDGVDVIGSD